MSCYLHVFFILPFPPQEACSVHGSESKTDSESYHVHVYMAKKVKATIVLALEYLAPANTSSSIYST